MTTSSAQTTCYTTLNDYDTITLTSTSGLSYTNCHTTTASSFCMPTITISNSGAGYTLGGLTTSQISAISTATISDFTINVPRDFVDRMPDMSRIAKMCEEYPGLKIAFEKFKTTYYLVKDDYDTPKDKRPKP